MQRRTGTRGLGAVLFTDIVGSTVIAAEMGNSRWAELLTRHHRIVRRELRRFGGRENDTAGDGFFATFERPVDAIRCAASARGSTPSAPPRIVLVRDYVFCLHSQYAPPSCGE